MRAFLRIVAATMLPAVAIPAVAAQPTGAQPASQQAEPLPEEYSCMFCHGAEGMLAESEDTKHLIVTEKDLAEDIHWQRGLRCHDCHGGNPVLDEFTDHRDDPSFLERAIATTADIPTFCGRCHSDLMYMRRFNPSARTDQEAEYWTSGHGQRLKKAQAEYQEAVEAYKQAGKKGDPPVFQDPKAATCVSCHGRHGILAVDDPNSPVYPTHVAETCASCHADEQLMAGLTYGDPPRPIGHEQYQQWRNSVHGRALLENGDLSAPTCNDCHGNHGALPPGVASVANACGTCHGKMAELFAATRMKHKFEEVGLPGCAVCHGSHQTHKPTDEMLGMGEKSICATCHKENRYGAPLAGAEAARSMRDGLERLKQQISEAEHQIAEAERLGMEVSTPRFDLRQAVDALTNARSLIHSFSRDRVEEALKKGEQVASEVKRRAEAALAEHTARRVWLALVLVPILIVVVLLLLYIRTLPLPAQ